jgi:hypothetical protein
MDTYQNASQIVNFRSFSHGHVFYLQILSGLIPSSRMNAVGIKEQNSFSQSVSQGNSGITAALSGRGVMQLLSMTRSSLSFSVLGASSPRNAR